MCSVEVLRRQLDRERKARKQTECLLEQKSRELYDANQELQHTIKALKEDISERERAEEELAKLNKKLVQASHLAGMAEVATSVLHNVGNVLNSVNVSSNLVAEKLRHAGIADFRKAADLIEQHREDLGAFVTQDEHGQHLGTFLIELSRHMATEEESILAELQSLQKNIEHVKDIVALQQSHTGVSGLTEKIALVEIVEDAIRVNIASIERHGFAVERDFDELPLVIIDKQKVLQILINLISNAKYALINSDHRANESKRITIRLRRPEIDRIVIDVEDNGVGIPSENLTRIFQHGFTTKNAGHGFGLHSSALHAKDLGGELVAHSNGPGTGATFSLEIPFETATECPTADLVTASV